MNHLFYFIHRNEVAYICNLAEHWFTLRKFVVPWRWYNLNSTQAQPTYLSETYLGMLLQQIQSERKLTLLSIIIIIIIIIDT